jgi:hypothetical protein
MNVKWKVPESNIFYHSVEMFLDHVTVLIVAKCFLDVETHQVEGNTLVEPTIRPLLCCDEATVKLVSYCFGKEPPRNVGLVYDLKNVQSKNMIRHGQGNFRPTGYILLWPAINISIINSYFDLKSKCTDRQIPKCY